MNVIFTNHQQLIKRGLPIALVAISGFMLASSYYSDSSKQRTSLTEKPATAVSNTAAKSSPTASPDIKVDGDPVTLDGQGKADVSSSDGPVHVEVSNGRTSVTTGSSSENSSTTQSNSAGNVNVNVHTQSTGGTTSGSTQMFSFDSTNGTNSMSSSNTTITNSGLVQSSTAF